MKLIDTLILSVLFYGHCQLQMDLPRYKPATLYNPDGCGDLGFKPILKRFRVSLFESDYADRLSNSWSTHGTRDKGFHEWAPHLGTMGHSHPTIIEVQFVKIPKRNAWTLSM